MIHPTQQDVNRFVVYQRPGQPPDAGRITSIGEAYVHVRFPGFEATPQACRREDLTFLDDFIRPAPLTEPELAAMASRHAATTQGEWRYDFEDTQAGRHYTVSAGTGPDRRGICFVFSGLSNRDGNGAFIARSHQDIPKLLAREAELVALLDDLARDKGLVDQTALPSSQIREENVRLREVLRQGVEIVGNPAGILSLQAAQAFVDAARLVLGDTNA